MVCERCGAPTKISATDGATDEGSFVEEYECANGHIGRISGRAEQPAQNWNRYGTVFDG